MTSNDATLIYNLNLYNVAQATFSKTLQPLAVNRFPTPESLEPIVDLQQDKGILYPKRISHLHSLCIATQVRESRAPLKHVYKGTTLVSKFRQPLTFFQPSKALVYKIQLRVVPTTALLSPIEV